MNQNTNGYNNMPNNQVNQNTNGYNNMPNNQVNQNTNGYNNMPNNQVNQNVNGYNNMPNNQMNQNTNGYNNMPNNQVNQNTNGYNNMPNNQVNQNVNGYNNMPNNQMNQNSQNNLYYQGQNNNYINPNDVPNKKKKMKWWIPVLLVVIGMLSSIINFTITIIIDSKKLKWTEVSPILNILQSIFSTLFVLAWFLVVPSIIVVIIMYCKKTPNQKKEDAINTNNMINNANSLDEKLLIAYIGDSYNYIKPNNFSIPALFFNWLYLLHRKLYIPAIIGLVISHFLGLLPNSILFIIIIITAIILGVNFNKWYIMYAKKQIEKLKSANVNISEVELINLVRKKGGTNFWIAIIIYIVITAILNFI